MTGGAATAIDRLNLIEELMTREAPFAAVLLADDFDWLREWAAILEDNHDAANEDALTANLALEAHREMSGQ